MRSIIGITTLAAAMLLPAGGSVPLSTATTYALPNVRLVAPENPVSYGDMVIVQAVVDKSNLPPNLVELKYQWVILDGGQRKQAMIWPDGTQIFFAAGIQPKRFVVVLDTHCLYATKAGDVIKDVGIEAPEPIVAVIDVGAGPPPTPPTPVPPDPTPPGPGPGPTPPAPLPPSPSPVLPDGQFKLAQFTYDSLKADATLKPDEKAKLAAALGPSFLQVASQIAALADFKDVEGKILPTLKQQNNAAIAASGVPVASTLPLKGVLNAQLYKLYKDDKKLSTAEDFGVAFREISQGFAAYK